MIEFQTEEQTELIQQKGFLVKVIGVGGAGSNVLDQIVLDGMDEAELICMNSDVRTLKSSTAHSKVQIGKQLTRGLGAGGDPELGILAAEEAEEEIRAAVRNQNMVFICAGLGGGTGSGAAPTIARIAKEEGAFVVCFATMPFSFEGRRRIEQAETALKLLERSADALVTFENDRMGELVLPKEGIQQAFGNADKIISQSVKAITYVVTQPGLIQIGMDDLLTALKSPVSRCLFGFGQSKGKNRAQEALKGALRSPLLDRGKLLGKSRNALVHVVGGSSMSLYEVELLMNEMSKNVGRETQILFGAATDEKMGDELSVTIISSLALDELREHEASTFEADTEPVRIGAAVTAESTETTQPVRLRVAEDDQKAAAAKAKEQAKQREATQRQEAKAREEAEAKAKAERDERERAEQEAAKAKAKADQADANGNAHAEDAERAAKEEAQRAEEEAERARRESFEKRRAELKKTAVQTAKPAAEAAPETAFPEPAPKPRAVNAEDLKEQRRQAQEELERKRSELEKLLKMEEEARRKRPTANAAPAAKGAPVAVASPDTSAAPPIIDIAEAVDLDQTQRITVQPQPRPQGPPSRKAGEKTAPVPPATPLSPKPAKVTASAGVGASDFHEAETAKVPDSTQVELELEPLRGRFEKAAPTMMDGENLDVPTFFRKRKKK